VRGQVVAQFGQEVDDRKAADAQRPVGVEDLAQLALQFLQALVIVFDFLKERRVESNGSCGDGHEIPPAEMAVQGPFLA
jgi:hypothetical protein